MRTAIALAVAMSIPSVLHGQLTTTNSVGQVKTNATIELLRATRPTASTMYAALKASAPAAAASAAVTTEALAASAVPVALDFSSSSALIANGTVAGVASVMAASFGNIAMMSNNGTTDRPALVYMGIHRDTSSLGVTVWGASNHVLPAGQYLVQFDVKAGGFGNAVFIRDEANTQTLAHCSSSVLSSSTDANGTSSCVALISSPVWSPISARLVVESGTIIPVAIHVTKLGS